MSKKSTIQLNLFQSWGNKLSRSGSSLGSGESIIPAKSQPLDADSNEYVTSQTTTGDHYQLLVRTYPCTNHKVSTRLGQVFTSRQILATCVQSLMGDMFHPHVLIDPLYKSFFNMRVDHTKTNDRLLYGYVVYFPGSPTTEYARKFFYPTAYQYLYFDSADSHYKRDTQPMFTPNSIFILVHESQIDYEFPTDIRYAIYEAGKFIQLTQEMIDMVIDGPVLSRLGLSDSIEGTMELLKRDFDVSDCLIYISTLSEDMRILSNIPIDKQPQPIIPSRNVPLLSRFTKNYCPSMSGSIEWDTITKLSAMVCKFNRTDDCIDIVNISKRKYITERDGDINPIGEDHSLVCAPSHNNDPSITSQSVSSSSSTLHHCPVVNNKDL